MLHSANVGGAAKIAAPYSTHRLFARCDAARHLGEQNFALRPRGGELKSMPQCAHVTLHPLSELPLLPLIPLFGFVTSSATLSMRGSTGLRGCSGNRGRTSSAGRKSFAGLPPIPPSAAR